MAPSRFPICQRQSRAVSLAAGLGCLLAWTTPCHGHAETDTRTIALENTPANQACPQGDAAAADTALCFEARLTPPNRITLRWKATDSTQPVYLYDDFGGGFNDIGTRPALCAGNPAGVCEKVLHVNSGGYYRWILATHNLAGEAVHRSAAISVPPAPGPQVDIGGSHWLDAAAPRARRISWRADETLASCRQDISRAWVEIRLPGEAFWSEQPRYPRCGAAAHLDIPAGELGRTGEHLYILRDCHRPRGGGIFCSNEVTTGFHVSADPAHADPTSPDTMTQAAVRWQLKRDFRQDFKLGRAFAVRGNGEPLDITYDADGGIWMVNEFSTTLEHVTPQGEVQSFTVPLGRGPLQTTNPARKVTRPFAISLEADSLAATSTTALAERVVEIGSHIWFTQGGGLLRNDSPAIPNHSRVVAFARAGKDRPDTHFDDRMCVYNMPPGSGETAANNQIVGLDEADGRIWVGETRGLFSQIPSAISEFVANDAHCGNLLYFEQPGALAEQSLQFCQGTQTAQSHACVQRHVLNDLPSDVRVAHLATDPADGQIWFSDARGGYLGRLNPRDGKITLFAFPDDHAALALGPEGFGGFTWTLRVDEHAVYIGEYLTRHIIRFDKKRQRFSEIAVPAESQQILLHSLDIDAPTQRLWFSLTNETRLPLDRYGSTIGYIDLQAWRQHLDNPDELREIPAVLYRGLHRVPASEWQPQAHQAFHGIAVDPRTGRIALATMHRRQITELLPKPSFRAPVVSED